MSAKTWLGQTAGNLSAMTVEATTGSRQLRLDGGQDAVPAVIAHRVHQETRIPTAVSRGRQVSLGQGNASVLDQAIGDVQPHRCHASFLGNFARFENVRFGLGEPPRLAAKRGARQQPTRQPVLLPRLTQVVDAAIERFAGIRQTVAPAEQGLEHCVETAFQEWGTTLEGEIETLSYPKAALFAFCLALVSDNMLSVVKAALRAAHGEAVVQQTLSSYDLADEIASTRRGLEIAIPDETGGVVAELPVVEFAGLLKEWAGHARLAAYKKPPVAPRSPAHPAKGAARSSM